MHLFWFTAQILHTLCATYNQYCAMTQPARRNFLPGHVVVIICSISIQLLNSARNINLEQHEQSYNKIVTTAFLGVLFLSYPLFGYIADVCLTRYRTLKCSHIFLIVGCTIGLIMSLVSIFANLTELFEKTSINRLVWDCLKALCNLNLEAAVHQNYLHNYVAKQKIQLVILVSILVFKPTIRNNICSFYASR